MKKIHDLEKKLRFLYIKPRLSFKAKLTLKLYAKMYSHFSLFAKSAFSFGILLIIITGIFGFNYVSYAGSYKYYADKAFDDLTELEEMIEGEISSNSFISITYADDNEINEEKSFSLLGNIVLNTEKALEKIEDLKKPKEINEALNYTLTLQDKEIDVFGRAAEIVDSESVLISFSQAIDSTYINIERTKKVREIVKSTINNDGILKERLNIEPALTKKIKEIKNSKNVEKRDFMQILKGESLITNKGSLYFQQKSAEENLRDLLDTNTKNDNAAKLADRYLKAVKSLETEKDMKAYSLFSSIEKETKYEITKPEELKSEINERKKLLDKSKQLKNKLKEKREKEKKADENKKDENMNKLNERQNSIQDKAGKKDIPLTDNEKVDFVEDILTSKEAEEKVYDKPVIQEVVDIYKSEEIPIDDKQKFWKEVQEITQDKNLQDGEIAEKLKEEAQKLLEEQELKRLELLKAEEDRLRLEQIRFQQEELKRLEQLKAAQAEEERKKLEQLRIQDEEKKRLEQLRLQEDNKRLEQLRLQQEEQKRLELLKATQAEEEERKRLEQLRLQEEEQKRLEELRKAQEEEKRLEELKKIQAAEEEQKRLEELRLQEEQQRVRGR